MPVTLGSTFDASVEALGTATRSVPAIPEAGQIRSLVFQTQEFFAALRAYPDTFARDAARAPGSVTVMSRALTDIRAHFAIADHHLAEALRRSAVVSGPAGEPAGHLQTAATHLGISRDLIRSHRGPDGDPLTPYLHLLASAGAQRYIFYRVTDVAWELGFFIERLAQVTNSPSVRSALRQARQALRQAVVLSRQANADRMVEFAELTPAPALVIDHAFQPDLPGTLARVGEECDRVIRAIFQANRGPAGPLSGSDLPRIARSLALGHLLTGRILLHLAEHQPPELGDQLRAAADGLRTTAQSWRDVDGTFRRIVDITDPREHPALPRYNYVDVQAGRVALMPRTSPHPAAISVQTLSVRIGQLLYGTQWTPTTPRPQPRHASDILNDTGGIGPLLRDLHRLPALGQHLAQAGPHLLHAIKHNLVTDSVEHRPFRAKSRTRWFPVSPRQLDHLLGVFHTAADHAKTAARAMVSGATAAGVDTPRARLDAVVPRLAAPQPSTPPKVPGINAPAVEKTPEPWVPAYRMPAARRDIERSLRLAYE
ncbi:hypothetical protein E1265_28905, partial [Streptomyces sp. 8K308]|uniref:hypothetical protein n=1 Tax=Streptomyces sp. 8K308 TaxID=2530388 RepID=UPI00104B01E6